MAELMIVDLTCGEPTVGIWCDACLLPSIVEFDILWLRVDGISPVGHYSRCQDCGGR